MGNRCPTLVGRHRAQFACVGLEHRWSVPVVDRQLRVLQVCARFLPELGGIERHVYEVARRLPERNVRTAVLTTDLSGTLPAEEEVDGINVARVPAWPLTGDWRVAPKIAGALRDDGWDVVHVQGIHTAVAPLAMNAARAAGIPYVVTFHTGGHSSPLRTLIRPVQWLALRPLLRQASRLIAVSRYEERRFRGALHLASRRFTVIQNGAEIVEADPADEPVDPDLIVTVGRVERYKGQWRLVEALPYLARERPGVRLRIVGDGPDRERVTALAERLGVRERVEVGPIPPEDRVELRRLVSRAGVFALLSDYEANPIAVMEALSLGRPVVVADTSGLSELAEQGWARSVSRRSSSDEVARALLAELDGPPRPRPVLPGWHEVVERLEGVYRQAHAPR